jgi:hypothetical protein
VSWQLTLPSLMAKLGPVSARKLENSRETLWSPSVQDHQANHLAGNNKMNARLTCALTDPGAQPVPMAPTLELETGRVNSKKSLRKQSSYMESV